MLRHDIAMRRRRRPDAAFDADIRYARVALRLMAVMLRYGADD